MELSDTYSQISLDRLHTLLLDYSSKIPDKLQTLEELRFKAIPETLAQRKKDGDSFLEKTDVTSLVEWKLYVYPTNKFIRKTQSDEPRKHGTYRPNLAKLVASNSVKDICETTRDAFKIYKVDKQDYGKAITTLSKLKGIGPATASLLLSCYDPVSTPFFSDELYRYLHWEEGRSKGWDRKINYSIKEYRSLFERLTELRERLENSSSQDALAIDIEKAAYVLGQSALPGPKKSPSITEDAEDDKALRPPSSKRRRKAPL